MENVRMSFSEDLKRYLVEEIESGAVSLKEAAERGHTTVSRVKLWLEEYGRFKPKLDRVEVVMKSEQDRISELEKALAEAHLKLRVSDEIIALASKKYRVDLKKNYGTRHLEESKDRPGALLKKSAKRSESPEMPITKKRSG